MWHPLHRLGKHRIDISRAVTELTCLISRLVLTEQGTIQLVYKPPFAISPLLREGIYLTRAT
jgi:hypothetical protein